jgi:hypothetical protein
MLLPRNNLVLSAAACLLLLTSVVVSAAPKRAFKNDAAAADSFQQKVDFIKSNAAAQTPSQKPVVFSQDEINAFFAERRLTMPEGVKRVVFDLKKNQVSASTTVDFQQIRQSRPSMNPLLAIFDGIHDCQVQAHAESAGPGMVHVRVESVVIDGITVPRMALEMFINQYVKPKYPNVGLDNVYRLPARIDSATLSEQQGTIVQK